MTQALNTRSEFRRDINGLRAWAVVAVVLYHFGVPGFAGGFAGVDVFFVISGFLMTGIVVAGLERGPQGFSFIAFYLARAKRIIPALAVLCAVLMLLGWWWLFPADYEKLGTQVSSSLTFHSNVRFHRDAGYFDAASHEKWLLHTWSLSVEWQFYMLLPLLLYLAWRLRPSRQWLSAVMLLTLLGSLAVSIVQTGQQPTAAFFLLPARAWEMLAGGLVYLLSWHLSLDTRQRRMLEWSGMVLVLGSVLGLDAQANWPGYLALIPVLGTTFFLLSARTDSLLTGNTVAQWLGTRSYSIYLWHWPLVVALNYAETQSDPVWVAAGLGLTILLADLSFRWVEVPAKNQLGQMSGKWAAVTICSGVLMLAASAKTVRSMDGIEGRLPLEVETLANESNNKKPRHDECFTTRGTQSLSCMYGGSRLRAVLIGDSHADALTTALAAAVPQPEDGIMDWSYISCPTVFGVKNLSPKYAEHENCGGFLEWARNKLAGLPKHIPLVVVNRATVYALGHNEPWESDANQPGVFFTRAYTFAEPAFLSEYAQRLTQTACELAKDRPVYLVRPIPEMGVDVPKAMARAALFGQHRTVSITLEQYHRRHAMVWAAQNEARDRCGVKILDPLPYLCASGQCEGARHGRPLYYDDDHLSEYGNRLLVPMFAQVFK